MSVTVRVSGIKGRHNHNEMYAIENEDRYIYVHCESSYWFKCKDMKVARALIKYVMGFKVSGINATIYKEPA